MNKFFHYSNPLWGWINFIFDFFLLGLIWVLCSLPFFTVGASASAAIYAACKRLEKGEDGILKPFFHSLRINFKQATFLWLLYVIVLVFLMVDYMLCLKYRELFPYLMYTMFIFIVAVGIIWLLTAIYLFPIQSHFKNTGAKIILNSLVLALHHFPWTLLICVADLTLFTAFLFLPGIFMFFVPGILLLIHSLVFRKIFRKYRASLPTS